MKTDFINIIRYILCIVLVMVVISLMFVSFDVHTKTEIIFITVLMPVTSLLLLMVLKSINK